MNRAAFVLMSVLVLAGCETTQPTLPTADDDPSAHCFNALVQDPRFNAIYAKTPRDIGEMTLAMAADSSRASADERVALSLLAKERQGCAEAGNAFRSAYAPPGWSEELMRFWGLYLDRMADLYAGKTTWGEFNQARRELAANLQINLQAVIQRDRAERTNQAAADRQNALNSYLVWRSLQPNLTPNRRPPAPTTCSSRLIGDTAYTTCQ